MAAPTAWQYAERDAAQLNNQRWWTQFGSPQLNRLIEQARRDSFDVAAAVARVRQAQATAVIAGAPLLPEVKFNLSTSHQKLLRGQGGPDLDATQSNDTVNSFGANLSASYEVDFWGGRAAARDSALHSLRASASDQATVELTLLSNVADRYAQTLAARQREQIAELNLANARNVLELVQTRYDAGSATALELAQQQSLVASQQRQLPLIQQLAQESRITLAALLGQPVQALDLGTEPFQALTWPRIGPGVPSQLLSRRPDLAKAEAELAAAQADVRVARAAMLPAVTLGATFGSDAGKAVEILRSPYYTLTGGLVGTDLQQRPFNRRTGQGPRAPGRVAADLSRGDHQRFRRCGKSPQQHHTPGPAAPMANARAAGGAERLAHRRKPLPGGRRRLAERAGQPAHPVHGPGPECATALVAPASQYRLVQSFGRRLGDPTSDKRKSHFVHSPFCPPTFFPHGPW